MQYPAGCKGSTQLSQLMVKRECWSRVLFVDNAVISKHVIGFACCRHDYLNWNAYVRLKTWHWILFCSSSSSSSILFTTIALMKPNNFEPMEMCQYITFVTQCKQFLDCSANHFQVLSTQQKLGWAVEQMQLQGRKSIRLKTQQKIQVKSMSFRVSTLANISCHMRMHCAQK